MLNFVFFKERKTLSIECIVKLIICVVVSMSNSNALLALQKNVGSNPLVKLSTHDFYMKFICQP